VGEDNQPGSQCVGRAHERHEALVQAAVMVEVHLSVHEQPVAQPLLVVLSGLPGSGKSYLARHLQPHLSATIIETDFVRRILFSKPRYTGPESGWVYAVCHELIARRLQSGQNVIFDATNLLEYSRQDLYCIVERVHARIIVIRVVAPGNVIRERLRRRVQQPRPGQYSDADVAVYEKLRETEQPIRHQHLVIDTTQDIEQNVQRILHDCHAQTMSHLSKPPYVVVNHTADIALRVHGETLGELFANAAAGMFAQMAALEQVPLTLQRQVTAEAEDNEALLVAWLSELLYLRDVHGEAYARFQVSFPAPHQLAAVADGGPWIAFDRPVKAVTFHGLKVEQDAGTWQATIVFDV
jgi:SHS2 domain-containing protein/predicted kinase